MTWARNVERDAEIARLTRAGHTSRQIAQRFGVTQRTVARVRVKQGVAQPGPQYLTADELNQARTLLEDGASAREVARTLGRHEATILEHFPGQGWQGSDRGRGAQLMAATRRIFHDLEQRALVKSKRNGTDPH